MLSPKKNPRRRDGFTLMELLLVLAILVVLGSMTVAFFGGTRQKAFINAAKGEIGIFKSSIGRYQLDVKKYPNSLEELINKPSGEEGELWGGPYVEGNEINKDPWGNPYRIAAPGKNNSDTYDLWSFGPDGQDGSDDDIGNW